MAGEFFTTGRVASRKADEALSLVGDADTAISAIEGDIDDLESADITISGLVSTEASTRGSADSSEAGTRAAADTALAGRCTALEAGTAGTPTNMVLAETVIGSWLGVPMYRKIIAVTGPNATTVTEPHGITGMARAVRLYGLIFRTSPSLLNLPLPYAHSDNNSHILLSADATNVNMISNIDFSTFAGHVVIEYTKS
jgi:hypothetical protein